MTRSVTGFEDVKAVDGMHNLYFESAAMIVTLLLLVSSLKLFKG